MIFDVLTNREFAFKIGLLMNIPSSARELVAAVAILTAACSPDPAIEETNTLAGVFKKHIQEVILPNQGLPVGATATESTEVGLQKCDFHDNNFTAHVKVRNRALEASQALDSFEIKSAQYETSGVSRFVRYEIKCNSTECVTNSNFYFDTKKTTLPLDQTAQNQIALTGKEICDLVGIVARKKPNQFPGRNRHLPN